MQFLTGSQEAVRDENGFLVQGAGGAVVEQACRYENARVLREIIGVDNTKRVQTGTIFMPKDAQNVPEAGVQVEVLGMFKGETTDPYRGQLNISIKV